MNQKMKELTDLITVGDDEYREGDVFLNVDKVWQWHCEQMREAIEEAYRLGKDRIWDDIPFSSREDLQHLFKDFGIEDNDKQR